jgi:hypothetical protein
MFKVLAEDSSLMGFDAVFYRVFPQKFQLIVVLLSLVWP